VKIAVLSASFLLLTVAGEDKISENSEKRVTGRQRFVPRRHLGRGDHTSRAKVPEDSEEEKSRPEPAKGRGRSSFLRRVVQTVDVPEVVHEADLVSEEQTTVKDTPYIGELVRVSGPGRSGLDVELNKINVGDDEVVFKEEEGSKRTYVPRRRLNVNPTESIIKTTEEPSAPVARKENQKVNTRPRPAVNKNRLRTRFRQSRPSSSSSTVRQDVQENMNDKDKEINKTVLESRKTEENTVQTARKRIRRPPTVLTKPAEKKKPSRQSNRLALNRKRIKMNMVDKVRSKQQSSEGVESEGTKEDENITPRASPRLKTRKHSQSSRRRFSTKVEDSSRSRHRLNVRKQNSKEEQTFAGEEIKSKHPKFTAGGAQTEVPQFTARAPENLEEHTALTDTSQWEEGRAQLKSARVPPSLPNPVPSETVPINVETTVPTETIEEVSDIADINPAPLKSEQPEVLLTNQN